MGVTYEKFKYMDYFSKSMKIGDKYCTPSTSDAKKIEIPEDSYLLAELLNKLCEKIEKLRVKWR